MARDFFFVDLAKNRRFVLDHLIPPTQQTSWQARNLISKRQLGSRSNADRDACIFRSCEPPRARAKVARADLVANFRRPSFDAVVPVGPHSRTSPIATAPH